MNTSKNRQLVDADTIAKQLRIHPETLRRKLRSPDNDIPFVRVGREYRFDPVVVYEHFVKKDILDTLEGYLADPKMPAVIRKAITEMHSGLREGWLSVEQCGALMHEMSTDV